MDTRTHPHARLKSTGVLPAPWCQSLYAALHPAISHKWGAGVDRFEVAEIFKKTPYVPDSKPDGRYVAKDMLEISKIPFLKALLANGQPNVNCKPVTALDVNLTAAEQAERKTKWKPRATNHTSGALWKVAHQVGPAVDGAVTHPGAAHENQRYADI